MQETPGGRAHAEVLRRRNKPKVFSGNLACSQLVKIPVVAAKISVSRTSPASSRGQNFICQEVNMFTNVLMRQERGVEGDMRVGDASKIRAHSTTKLRQGGAEQAQRTSHAMCLSSPGGPGTCAMGGAAVMGGKGASRDKVPGSPARPYLALVSLQMSPVWGCLARKRLKSISFLQRR